MRTRPVTSPWRFALDQLLRRKLRTTLTLLGVILGTAAMISMLGVGEGSRREALNLVKSLGIDNLLVENATAQSSGGRMGGQHTSLSVSDMDAAARFAPAVIATAGYKTLQTWGVYSHDLPAKVDVVAVSPNYFPLASLTTVSGRLIHLADDEAAAPVAVLGSRSAQRLFPAEPDPVGRLRKINHVAVRIIGVLNDTGTRKDRFQGVSLKDDSNTIFLPLSTGAARFRSVGPADEVDRIYLKVGFPSQLSAVAEQVSQLLKSRHNGIEDFSLVIPLKLFRQSQQTQKIFDIVVASVAVVCLIVGGIGIMNIMLANVLERRREIGLIRAVGASRSDIVRQFLREALVVSVTGVMTGALMGISVAYAIGYFSGWSIGWPVLSVGAWCLICVLIGTGFGVYPALQAAKLDPIAAIRDE